MSAYQVLSCKNTLFQNFSEKKKSHSARNSRGLSAQVANRISPLPAVLWQGPETYRTAWFLIVTV